MGRLSNRVVFVMGGGADGPPAPDETLPIGNGRAIAIEAALEGAQVAVADRNLELAKETAYEIRKRGGEAMAFACEVADEVSCERAISASVEAFGKLNGLVNNVGTGDGQDFERTLTDDFDKAYAINLRGPFFSIRHAIPHLRRAGAGSIVNISSVSQIRSPGTGVSYETSKAALGALTRNAAATLGPEIRVNSILPGTIYSTILRRWLGVDAPDLSAAIPLGRLGSPWEVAKSAVFLLSDDASYITGVDLMVDGGASLGVPGFPFSSGGAMALEETPLR